MIERTLQSWLEKQKNNNKVIQIQGLRQTGKTTLMEAFMRSYPGALHYPLQNLNTLLRYEGKAQNWVLEIEQYLKKWDHENRGPLPVFVDEIQKIPLLYQGIQGLYDQHKGKIKFWIWGSSARPTKRQRAETLAGRIFTKILHPLSQEEIFERPGILSLIATPTDLENHFVAEPADYACHLNRSFTQSLMPEAYLIDDTNLVGQLLESYQSTYLENEIRRENLVSDIGLFSRFLNLAAHENTEIVNYSTKAKVLDISPTTIKNYYAILEDTFVCSSLPAYSTSLRVQYAKSPKVYFTDAGLALFVAGVHVFPEPGTTIYGKLFEGFVVSEIKKQVENHSLPWKLSYFRTKTGMEVDMMIETPDKNIAVEIKSARRIERGHYKDILKFMEVGKNVSHGIVISLDARLGRLTDRIYNVPAWLI